jgi:hypothetical protein
VLDIYDTQTGDIAANKALSTCVYPQRKHITIVYASTDNDNAEFVFFPRGSCLFAPAAAAAAAAAAVADDDDEWLTSLSSSCS